MFNVQIVPFSSHFENLFGADAKIPGSAKIAPFYMQFKRPTRSTPTDKISLDRAGLGLGCTASSLHFNLSKKADPNVPISKLQHNVLYRMRERLQKRAIGDAAYVCSLFLSSKEYVSHTHLHSLRGWPLYWLKGPYSNKQVVIHGHAPATFVLKATPPVLGNAARRRQAAAVLHSDFHAPQSMIRARTGLSIYLYGYDHDWHHDGQGQLVIEPRRVAEHRWGEKVIPSGFFDQEGAEHISAVLFNNSATLSKFNRMGFVAGFGSRRVQMVRAGTALNPDPNAAEPLRFTIAVDADYHETWSEGLEIYHNPRALHPLDPRHFPTAMHHNLQQDGQVASHKMVEEFHPLASMTSILVPRADEVAP